MANKNYRYLKDGSKNPNYKPTTTKKVNTSSASKPASAKKTNTGSDRVYRYDKQGKLKTTSPVPAVDRNPQEEKKKVQLPNLKAWGTAVKDFLAGGRDEKEAANVKQGNDFDAQFTEDFFEKNDRAKYLVGKGVDGTTAQEKAEFVIMDRMLQAGVTNSAKVGGDDNRYKTSDEVYDVNNIVNQGANQIWMDAFYKQATEDDIRAVIGNWQQMIDLAPEGSDFKRRVQEDLDAVKDYARKNFKSFANEEMRMLGEEIQKTRDSIAQKSMAYDSDLLAAANDALEAGRSGYNLYDYVGNRNDLREAVGFDELEAKYEDPDDFTDALRAKLETIAGAETAVQDKNNTDVLAQHDRLAELQGQLDAAGANYADLLTAEKYQKMLGESWVPSAAAQFNPEDYQWYTQDGERTQYNLPSLAQIIENPEAVKGQYEQARAAGAGSGMAQTIDLVGRMTEEEKALYKAIYAEQGEEAADAYFRHKEAELYDRQNTAYVEEKTAFAEENPLWASVASLPEKLLGTLGMTADMLAGREGQNQFAEGSQAERAEVERQISEATPWAVVNGTNLMGSAYQGFMSFMDSLFNRAVTGVAGGGNIAGDVLLGLGSAADAYSSAYEATDGDVGKAIVVGLASGALEAGTEHISWGKLSDAGNLDSATNVLKYILAAGTTEGGEEVISGLGSKMIEGLVMGGDSEIAKKYMDYTANGYKPIEAIGRMAKEIGWETTLEFFIGSLMGGGAASVNAAVQVGQQASADRSLGRQIQDKGNAAAVIRAALASADEKIRALGNRLASKIQEGGLPQDSETAAELQVVAEAEGLDANGQKTTPSAQEQVPPFEIKQPDNAAVPVQRPAEEAAPVVEEEPVAPVAEETGSISEAEETPELEWNEPKAEQAAPAAEKVTPEEAKKAVTEVFKGSTRKLGKLYRKMMGALDVEISTKSVEEIKTAVQNRLKQLGEDVIDPVATAIAKLASGEQMTSDELDLLEASTVRQGVLNEVATSLIRNGGREYLSDETVNLMEHRSALRQATTAKNVTVAQKQTAAAPARVQEMVEETIAADEDGSIQARAQMLGNEEAAQTMIKMAEGVTNTRAYATAFEAAYDYGTAGIDQRVASTSKETTALTPEQFQAAYQAGVKAAAAPVRAAKTGGKVTFAGDLGSRLNEMDGNQRAGINALRKIASLGTVNIEFFQSEANAEGKYTAENGSYDPKTNTIRIDVNAGRNNVRSANNFALLRVASHELTHYIKAQNTEGYKALQDFVVKQLPGMGDKSFDALVAEKMVQQPELSYSAAVEEVVANGCEMMLKDSTAIQQLAQENKGLFRRIRNWLRNFIASVKRAFRGVEAYSTEATLIKDLEGLQKLWDDALVRASRNVQQSAREAAPVNTEAANKKYSVRLSANDIAAIQSIGKKSVNDFTSADINKTEKLARRYFAEMGVKSPFFKAWFGDWRAYDKSAVILAKAKGGKRGVVVNLDTNWNIQVSGKVFNESKAHKGKNNKEALPYLEYINDIVKNAVLLDTTSIDSPKSANSLLMHSMYAVADIGNGAEVLKLYVEELNDVNADGTIKRSYQLQNIENQQLTVKGSGNSLASSQSTADVESVADLHEIVKARGELKGSKSPNPDMLNEDGSPKVMYHGTPYGGFTVFKDWQYFTDNQQYADVYQNPSASSIRGRYNEATNPTTYAAYLSVKKPFDTRDPKVRKIWQDEFYGKWGDGTPLSERGLPDWTEGIDLVEFLEENGYDFDAIILDEGGTGGYGEAVNDRGVSVVVRSSNQIKSATDNIGTFDPHNPDIRYSSRLDNEYRAAYEAGNEAKASKLVREAAIAAGYNPLKLYHGTPSFGFTKIDPSKSDDGISFFASADKNVSKSYVGDVAGVRRIGRKNGTTLDQLTGADDKTILSMLREYFSESYQMVSDVSKAMRQKLISRMNKVRKANADMFANENVASAYDDLIATIRRAGSASDLEELNLCKSAFRDAWRRLRNADFNAYEALDKIEAFEDFFDQYYELEEYFKGNLFKAESEGDVEYATRNQAIETLIHVMRENKGIYELYGKTDNFLEIDGKGESWNKLDGGFLLGKTHANTRDFAKYAKEMGFDGVHFKNIYDLGGRTSYRGASDVYTFFNPSDIKSADPFTFDDDGELIPLSERFSQKNEDIRYSKRAVGNEVFNSIRTDSLTDREILADAFENVVQNDTERSFLKNYRDKIADLQQKQAQLREINRDITKRKENTPKRANGHYAYDGETIRQMNRAKILRTQIDREDNAIIEMIKSKPLQDVLRRQKKRIESEEAGKRREAIAAIRDRKNATEVRHKIKAVLDDFNRRLKNPTEKSYIPANMVQLVIAAEELIDTRSGREGEKAQAKLAALQGMYERYKSDATFAYVYDPVIADMLGSLSNVVGNKSIYQLNSAELQSVYETLKALKKQVTEAVQLKAGNYARTIIEAGREMIRETQAAAPLAKGKAGEFLNWQLTPDKFFARLAGFKKNSIWSKVAESFSKGTEKMLEIQRDHYYHFKKFTESKEFDKLNDQKHLVDIGLTNDKGETVKVTRGMMLSAYMHLSNEENARGFMYGGFSIPNLKAYYDGKVKESYGRGSANTRGTAQELYELAQQMNDPNLTEEQLEALEAKHDQLIMEGMNRLEQMRNDIYSQMTQYEKDLVAAVRAWNDGKSQAYINDVTMDLYGIKKASVQNYFPIHRDTAFVNTDFASISRNVNLENWGSLKTRVPSQAPILLTDIAYEMDSSLNQMSRYVGYARAQRDFGKLYNVRMPGMSGSVKKAVSVKFGTGAGLVGVSGEQYIENYIGSITGSRQGQSGPLSLIRRNLVRSTMTLNLRVGFSQLSAIPKAAAEVGWDSMISGFANGGFKAIFSKSAREDLAKQNAWFWQRYRGEGGQREFADAKGGNDIISKAWNKMDDITRGKLLNWCQNFDVMSTVSMWSMAKAWARKHTNYAEGSAEFIEAANKKYTDIIRNTQAMSTTSEQSDAARTPGDVLNMFTMFKSEAFANFNLLYDAVAKLRKYSADFKAGKNDVTKADVNAAKRHLAGAATSVIIGATFGNAILKLAINALMHAMNNYRDDEDEIGFESILTAIGKEMASDTAGMVMLGGELYEFISAAVMGDKYYAPSDMALSEITEMLETIMKVAQDEDRTAEDVLNAGKKVAFNLTNIFGVPAENGKRFVKMIQDWYDERNHDTPWYKFEGGVTRTNSTNYDRLYNAAIAGDDAKFDSVLVELAENGVEEKDAREGFRNQVKDAYEDGSISEDKALELLVTHGDKDKDEAFWTMDKWNYKGEADYSRYTDLRTALKESNASAAKTEIQKLTGHGVEEKTVISELSTMYNNGEATTIMNLQLRSNNLYTSNLKLKTDKEVHKDDFDAFLTAVVNGSGVTNEVNKLYQKGYTTKQIMSALNGAFGNSGKKYRRMEYYNPAEAKILLDRILKAYEAIGLDRNEEIAWINENWEKFVPDTDE